MSTIQQQNPAQVSIKRNYPVTAEKIWRAWTDPQALSRWFGAGAGGEVSAAEIDLREGGRYRIAFSGAKGESHEASGVYQEVQAHRRLVFSWAWKSTPERVSRVAITLTPLLDGSGTELGFVHDRFFDEAARANHERGWAPFFEKLGNFLQEA